MQINSRNYPDPDNSPFHIPAGEYLCIINNVIPDFKTKNPGEDCWHVEGEIAIGEHIGKKWQDRWIFNSQNPNTQKRQVLIQHRVGGLAKIFEGDVAPEDFIGREIYVTFKDNLYNGKIYHKVTFNGYRTVEQEAERQAKFDAIPKETFENEPDIDDSEIPF